MKKTTFWGVLVAVFALSGVLPLVAQNRSGRSEARRPASTSRPRVVRQRPAPRARVIIQRPAPRRPRIVYRNRGYYGSNYGYSYGHGYGYANRYYVPATGIRFHLELVPGGDRDVVKRGIVVIDGSEQGIVDRFDSWQNGHVPVAAGEHDVLVELEDGRVFQTNVVVQVGQVLHVYIRF